MSSNTPTLYIRLPGTDDFYPIDAAQDADAIREDASEYVSIRTGYPASETADWEIQAHVGFHGAFTGFGMDHGALMTYLRDHLEMVSAVAQMMEYVGSDRALQVAALVQHVEIWYVPDSLDELRDLFDERYCGEFESVAEWAYKFLDDIDYFIPATDPQGSEKQMYFDYDKWARDQFLSGYYSSFQFDKNSRTVYVFSNV